MSLPATMPLPEAPRAQWASAYAQDHGVALVLIPPGIKGPTGKAWNKNPITDAGVAERTWKENPSHNMGALLGSSELVSFDVDDVAGARAALANAGFDLDAILREGVAVEGNPAKAKRLFRAPAGIDLPVHKLSWPPDPASTPDKDGRRKRVMILELRAGDGLQDVLPPSTHPGTKQPYRFLVGRDPWTLGGFPEMPVELLRLWNEWPEVEAKLRAACPWEQATEPKSGTDEPSDERWAEVRREILRRLPIREVLKRAGVTVPTAGRRFSCPIHQPDRDPSAWLWTPSGGEEVMLCAHGKNGSDVGVETKDGHLLMDALALEAWLRRTSVGKATAELAREIGIPVGSQRKNAKAAGCDATEAASTVEEPDFDRQAASSAEPSPAIDEEALHDTDLGNSRVFLELHGEDVRFCEPFEAWLWWDGRRWNRNAKYRVARWAKDVPRDLHRRAKAAQAEIHKLERAALKGDEQAEARAEALKPGLKNLERRANKAEMKDRLIAIVECARSELLVECIGNPPTPLLDLSPSLFNSVKGTLDMITGELRSHLREDMITKLSRVAYDPDAKCPTWDRFCLQIMGGQQLLVDALHRAAGLSLTGETRERCLFFCYGKGANGKTKFLETVAYVAGDYGGSAPPDLLLSKKGERHPAEIAFLHGKRFVYTVEPDKGRSMAEALVKQLTGGDTLCARGMRENFWEFAPTHKLWLAANHKPEIRGTDNGIWDRIVMIPFTVRFWDPDKGESGPEELRQDKKLGEKLKAEAPGILAKLVRGAMDYYENGLQVPDAWRAASQTYRVESDVVARWAAECVSRSDSDLVMTRAQDVQQSFAAWHVANFGEKPPGMNEVAERLEALGFSKKRNGSGNFYLHMRLSRPEETEEAM